MKKILVIGSTVVDIILKLPYLPKSSEDVNITSMDYQIGGCAYNIYSALINMKIPALLCSPVGNGVYGNIVKEHFNKNGITPFITLKEENGCCYCLVEPDGERSFLSYHGAEYLFYESWMKNTDLSQFDDAYISGLELEEATGIEIINFLYKNPSLRILFAPGPRIMHIADEKIKLILSRRDREGRGPLLHLNKNELITFTGINEIEKAARFLMEKTANSIIITLGDKGSCFLDYSDNKFSTVAVKPLKAENTVGAGDTHFGTFIACYKNGLKLEDACFKANMAAREKLSP